MEILSVAVLSGLQMLSILTGLIAYADNLYGVATFCLIIFIIISVITYLVASRYLTGINSNT